jgi:hypothetical protein
MVRIAPSLINLKKQILKALNTHHESTNLVNLSSIKTDHKKKLSMVTVRNQKVNLIKKLTRSGITLKVLRSKELLLTKVRRPKTIIMSDHRLKVDLAITIANVVEESQSVTTIRMKKPRPTIMERMVRGLVNQIPSTTRKQAIR